jgi:hypothetical protein
MAILRAFSCLVILSGFLSACTRKSDTNEKVIKYLNESFEPSRVIINKATETVFSMLEQKLLDPASSQRAQIWLPRAKLVQAYSKEILSHIEGIKMKLKEGLYRYNNIDQVEGSDKEFRLLEKKLRVFRSSIMAVDSALTLFYPNPLRFDNGEGSAGSSYPIYLLSDNISIAGALGLLNQFENNIKIMEFNMVEFANNKCGAIIEDYYSYSAIIAINSSRTFPGDKLEITAGLGAFRWRDRPKITVDGNNILLAKDGAAHYTFIAPAKGGKYKIPVRLEFLNEEGKQEVIEKNVDYMVVE